MRFIFENVTICLILSDLWIRWPYVSDSPKLDNRRSAGDPPGYDREGSPLPIVRVRGYHGITPRNFWNSACNFISFDWIRNGTIMWKQVVEHHICLITDESHLIYGISSKSGNRDRNGTRRKKRDNTASRLMSKIFQDRNTKMGLSRDKNGTGHGCSPFYEIRQKFPQSFALAQVGFGRKFHFLFKPEVGNLLHWQLE